MRFKKLPLYFFALVFLGIPLSSFAASSPLDYKTFVHGASLWICEPSGILMFRNDTRSVRSIVLCDTVDNDTVFDVAENGGALWVLAKSGVYQIDLSTTTVERLPGLKSGAAHNKLAVDDDYLWITLDDMLWRFDKLGREWFSYPLNTKNSPVCGLSSDGANVYCVLPFSIKIFSTKDEKLLEFPYKKGMSISSNARFYLDKNALVLVDGSMIYRYIIDSQSWDIITTLSPVIDIVSQDSVIFYQSSKGMFQYFTNVSITRPFDIPGIESVSSFSRLADTLFLSTPKSYIKFDINAKTTDNIEAPQNGSDFFVKKTLLLHDTIIAVCPNSIAACNTKSRLWQTVAFSVGAKKSNTFVWDDNNGAKLSYKKGYCSQLKGYIQEDFSIDSITPLGTFYTPPITTANLILHNQFAKGNYLDLFFDNSDLGQVPKKGAFYRGTTTDLVESARMGTNTLIIPQSKTILQPQFEGASIALQSAASLSLRDRKIVKAQAGGGLITTKTLYEVLPYSDSRIYSVSSFKNDPRTKKVVVPGSFKVNVDGEDIDSVNFTFALRSGTLTFNRQDLLDPTSIITVSYQVRTVPDSGLGIVEFIPENNFGTVAFSSATISPTDWISPQIGVVHLRTDSVHVHDLIHVSSPSEIRSNEGGIVLKMNPEITYDEKTSKKAAALSVQSLLGKKLSLQSNALVADSGFITTDNLDRGYGYLKHDVDMTLAYDIKKELPVSYYQHDILSERGTERRYEIKAGAHFLGMPFCDLSVSRNTVDANRTDTLHPFITVQDTTRRTIAGKDSTIVRSTALSHDSIVNSFLDRNKDKLRLRLYETSSPIMESLLHINRLNYELSYTGFLSQKEEASGIGQGSIFYGRGTISPIKRMTATILGTYMKNAPGSLYSCVYNPSVIVQTIDAPPGFDISIRSQLDVNRLGANDSSAIVLNRTANLTFKPGTWLSALNWIQPIAGFNQTIRCGLLDNSPDYIQLLFPKDNITQKVTATNIGANIFPTNDVTFRNDNQFTKSDSMNIYYSFNDMKWWFGEKRFWQIRWEYDHNRPRFNSGENRDYNRGFTQFINTWTPWLQTMAGVASSILTTDTMSQKKIGPNCMVSINTQRFLFLRSFLTNHTVNISYTKNHQTWQSAPDILYSSYIRFVFMPNISLDANTTLTFRNGEFILYSGRISATSVF